MTSARVRKICSVVGDKRYRLNPVTTEELRNDPEFIRLPPPKGWATFDPCTRERASERAFGSRERLLFGLFYSLAQSSRDTPGKRHELKFQGNPPVPFSIATGDRAQQPGDAGYVPVRVDYWSENQSLFGRERDRNNFRRLLGVHQC